MQLLRRRRRTNVNKGTLRPEEVYLFYYTKILRANLLWFYVFVIFPILFIFGGFILQKKEKEKNSVCY